jgi:hypothetical protein
VQGLESGLADYFPCSINGDSDFGKEIFADIAKKNPGITMPSRNLDNHHSFSEIQPGKVELHDEGTIWGGAYWQMRTSIGREASDKLLLAAWKNFRTAPNPSLTQFPRELLRQDTTLYGGAHSQEIQRIFETRGLKF